jgi:origin recognition complex subunit 6
MEQVSRFSRRFQLSPAASSQAGELYRLAEVKGMLGMRGVSSTSLALVCLELAAGQHGETFDKKQAQKLSGLQPRAYTNTVNTASKMLNISSTVSLQELAVRFGCLDAEQLASEILKSYREKVDSMYSEMQKESLDITKPLYSTAALYTACKLLKIQSDKTRFQSAANCPSRAVFQTILDQMSTCAPTTAAEREVKVRKRKRGDKVRASGDTQEEADPTHRDTEQKNPSHTRNQHRRELLESRIVSSPFSQDYLLWKDRVITAARAEMASQQEHDTVAQ